MTPEQKADVDAALLAYWTSRDEAQARQLAKGVSDVGGRATVTAGGHLDRVAQMLARVCIKAGAPRDEVYYKAPDGDPNKREGSANGYTLPGYYRPTKAWDLVVYSNKLPIVVVELKSQNGPSYSNNANNRAEEAVGNAVDLKRAREAGLIKGDPWTGFAFVIQDDATSSKLRGKNDRGFFGKDALFTDWSYVQRVRFLTQRLAEEGHYDGVWAVATAKPPEFSWHEPDEPASGYSQFVEGLKLAIQAHYASSPDDAHPDALFDIGEP